MKVLAWNCRGLRNQLVIPALCLQVRQQDPDLVFLSETKLLQHEFERLKGKISFPRCFSVSSSDRRGGLGLLWKEHFGVEILIASNNVIDTKIKMEEEGKSFRFFGFYGFLNVVDRDISWKILKSLYWDDNTS